MPLFTKLPSEKEESIYRINSSTKNISSITMDMEMHLYSWASDLHTLFPNPWQDTSALNSSTLTVQYLAVVLRDYSQHYSCWGVAKKSLFIHKDFQPSNWMKVQRDYRLNCFLYRGCPITMIFQPICWNINWFQSFPTNIWNSQRSCTATYL